MIINLAGDVMIGRLIDQLLPTSVDNREEALIIERFRSSRTYLQKGKYQYETGNLNVINLETSMTTYDQLWPNKVFNYRTHPENVNCLKVANINHVSLANNHTLDFGIKGLVETCETLKKAGISYVGAGKTREEALGPVYLDVNCDSINVRIGFLSASDHPSDWSRVSSFHLLPQYNLSTLKTHLSPLIAQARSNSNFVIFSLHWGPNYQWIPDKKLQELGRWMIHEGVDVIHGHSSHHIQGIEIIQRSNRTSGLIIYGCGDLVDDYAIDDQYRNDLSAIFRLNINVKNSHAISLQSLSIYPTRCSNFHVNLLDQNDQDWLWVKQKLFQLSQIHSNKWTIGTNGQFILNIQS